MLHAVVEGAGPRVVLVHGFTQTGASWAGLAERLVASREVVRVDLPGHGGSGPLRMDFGETVSALGARGGAAAYVGYSLGGRLALALALALARPEVVHALVLVGASPGIADDEERRLRREADEALARRIEDRGVDAFLDEWIAQPLFAGLDRSAAGLDDRRVNTAGGLASALRSLGTGAQPSLWDGLGRLEVPVLLVAGARDLKFAAIARDVASRIGAGAQVAVVPDAGHACHLERPRETAGLVEEFLADHPTR